MISSNWRIFSLFLYHTLNEWVKCIGFLFLIFAGHQRLAVKKGKRHFVFWWCCMEFLTAISSSVRRNCRERDSPLKDQLLFICNTFISDLPFVLAKDIWCNFEKIGMPCADFIPRVYDAYVPCARVCTYLSVCFCVDASVWSSTLKHKEALYCIAAHGTQQK